MPDFIRFTHCTICGDNWDSVVYRSQSYEADSAAMRRYIMLNEVCDKCWDWAYRIIVDREHEGEEE